MEIRKIAELRERIEKALADYFSSKCQIPDGNRDIGYINPAADVYLDGNRQLVFIETPTLIEDSVKIDIAESDIRFTAGKETLKGSGRKYLQIERKIGEFTKSIPRAWTDRDIISVEHSYKFGVIKIEIEYSEAK